MEYNRLTKKTIINDTECITCALYGTRKCKIHTDNIETCLNCPVLGAMISQLHIFEEVYTTLPQNG